MAALESAAPDESVYAFPATTVSDGETALDVLPWPDKELGVSERESEALVLLGEGLTNTEIATALYLSLETVKSHVSTIYAKLGVNNRVRAANYVADTGVLPVPSGGPGGHRASCAVK